MHTRSKGFMYIVMLGLIVTLGVSVKAQAPYRVTDKEVETLINNLDHETDNFKGEVGHALDKSSVDGTRREDNIKAMIAEFETATDKLHDNFSKHSSAAADVSNVLTKGAEVNRFMRHHDMGAKANEFWGNIRGMLDTLAGFYSVTIYDWSIDGD